MGITRPLLVSASMIATLAFMAVGCGGSAHRPEVASVSSGAAKRAHVTYPAQPNAAEVDAAVHCMRTHGLPNFPDPIVMNGKKYFGFSTDSGIDTSSLVYKEADRCCEDKYMHVSDRRSPSQRSRSNTDALKYTACIRSHGVSDFPDPNGIGEIHVPTATYLDTPKVRVAQRACKPLFTGSFVFFVPFR